MGEKIKMWCRNCRQWFELDRDVPLDKQLQGHTWGIDNTLRCLTWEDHEEERADREICPECGVPHGPYADTGCGL